MEHCNILVTGMPSDQCPFILILHQTLVQRNLTALGYFLVIELLTHNFSGCAAPNDTVRNDFTGEQFNGSTGNPKGCSDALLCVIYFSELLSECVHLAYGSTVKLSHGFAHIIPVCNQIIDSHAPPFPFGLS